MRVLHEADTARLRSAGHLSTAKIVEIAVDAGEDDRHLLLDRHRRELVLLQHFDQALAAIQLVPAKLCRDRSRTARKPPARDIAPGRDASVPATDRMALICALPPTRLTEMPTLMAGRTFELNRSASR